MTKKEDVQRFSLFCPTTLFNILNKANFIEASSSVPLERLHDRLVVQTILKIVSKKYSRGNACLFLKEIISNENNAIIKDVAALILLVLDDFETKIII